MRFSLLILALPALIALPSPATAQNMRPELHDTDLRIAGFALSADTAQVRRHRGAPTKIVVNTARNEDGELLTEWHYPDLVAYFDEHGKCWLIRLLTPRIATTRGARLGSTRSEVTQLYGTATAADSAHAVYGRYAEDMDTRGIAFTFTNGRVSSIALGNVISVE